MYSPRREAAAATALLASGRVCRWHPTPDALPPSLVKYPIAKFMADDPLHRYCLRVHRILLSNFVANVSGPLQSTSSFVCDAIRASWQDMDGIPRCSISSSVSRTSDAVQTIKSNVTGATLSFSAWCCATCGM